MTLPTDAPATQCEGLDELELEALVARFEHRVRFFAQRVARRYGLDPVWRDDLVSAGYFGLLKALRNRRSDAHANELSAYVSKRIEGAILDEARQVLERASSRADWDPGELEEGGVLEAWNADGFARPSGDPEHEADGRSRWRRIEGSFAHLQDFQREWLLALAAGQSLAEIARSDGASPARLQNQMTRVTRSIRAQAPELRRLLRHEI